MIFCHCAAVTDSDLARVLEDGASTLAQVARRCGAGRRCAPCRSEIAKLLYYRAREARDAEHTETESGRRAA